MRRAVLMCCVAMLIVSSARAQVDYSRVTPGYTIELPRDEECSACGNFLGALAANYGLSVDALPDLPVSPGKDR